MIGKLRQITQNLKVATCEKCEMDFFFSKPNEFAPYKIIDL